MTKFRFSKKPFTIFCLLLFIEILIAPFIKDSLIRPYGGDILVVILIYHFIDSFVAVKPFYNALLTLLFAYIVEIAQFFDINEYLNINNKIIRIIIGSSFSWADILCYTIGVFLCLFYYSRKK